jgi:3-phosphoglycerate kinase
VEQTFKKITDEKNVRGKRILVRLDLNVPIINGEVRDDFRIKRSIPTLTWLRDQGAKTIVISHLESAFSDSLERVAAYISKDVPLKAFVTKLDDASTVISSMQDGDVIMLENLRKDPGEKENSSVFADKLARLADIYVNDAFAVSHRSHASIVSVPRLLPSFAGPLLSTEITELSKCFSAPKPFIFILGGAKFETKMPLVERFLKLADEVFVGGALANDLFKEKGFEVGLSVISKSQAGLERIANDPKLFLPSDVATSGPLAKAIKNPDEVGLDEKILDAGPRTISKLSLDLAQAKFVLWNGPLGDYEHGFAEGSEALAKAIIESGATSVLGGGDTIAVVSKLGLLDKFSFVSTGGGAMIEFLAKGTLPGIEALKN